MTFRNKLSDLQDLHAKGGEIDRECSIIYNRFKSRMTYGLLTLGVITAFSFYSINAIHKLNSENVNFDKYIIENNLEDKVEMYDLLLTGRHNSIILEHNPMVREGFNKKIDKIKKSSPEMARYIEYREENYHMNINNYMNNILVLMWSSAFLCLELFHLANCEGKEITNKIKEIEKDHGIFN